MKTHKFDPLSFVAGLLITVIGLAFLLLPDFNALVDVLSDAGSWFWPVLLIAIGVAVLAPVAVRSTRGESLEEGDE